MGNQFKIYVKDDIKGKLYGGKSCGRHIRWKISKAKQRIWILSPYIDEIIEETLKKVDDNVDVKIITNEDALIKLLSKTTGNYERFSYYFEAIQSPVKIGNHSYQYYRVKSDLPYFHFIRSSEFIKYIHAKLFLIDNELFLGSINYTKSAFESNFEIRFLTDSDSAITSTEQFIEKLLLDTNIITETPRLNVTLKSRWNLLKQLENITDEKWEKLKEFCKDTLQIDEDDE